MQGKGDMADICFVFQINKTKSTDLVSHFHDIVGLLMDSKNHKQTKPNFFIQCIFLPC